MAQFSEHPCKTEELKQIWETVFGDSRTVTDSFFENAFFADGCFYAEKNEKAVSALYLLPVTVADKQGFYLYAAATLPEHRGQGLMGDLIQEALRYAASCSDFVYLCPAEESLYDYYRRFGFSQTLYANFLTTADCMPLADADEMYRQTQSMKNAPLFAHGVYRYAASIGCEMFCEGAVRFGNDYVFADNVPQGERRPYGMLASLHACVDLPDLFAFLTMN